VAGPAALVAAAMLAGCVPGKGPLPPPRTDAGLAAARSLPGAPGAAWPGDGWWERYGDPQLSALIVEGLAGSPDIAAAAARLAKSAGMAQQAGAALLPRVDAQGSASENRISLNNGYPPQFVAFLPQGWKDTGQIYGSIGFDPDIWGRNRAQLAAATSQARAAQIDARAGRLAVATAIADAYVDLAGLVAVRDARAAALANRAHTEELVAGRQKNGLDPLFSLRTAEAQSAAARSDLSAAEQAVTLRRHQIAALMGEGPDRALSIADPKLAPLEARPLPEDVTTDLLGRRGDVVAARARVEAQASLVKVARADFFPALHVSALFGLQSLPLGMLFDHNSQYGNATAAVSLPIFHGGELKGRYGAARGDYDAAVADYDKVVIGAYQQVADAVTARGQADARLADNHAAVAGAQSAYDIAQARYKVGLASYLDVLTAEDKLLGAQFALAQVDTQFRAADIALVRALGGGFTPDPVLAKDASPHG
jgi:NodT family efflux transporter outer membrane factor (OMF) lipoprotein